MKNIEQDLKALKKELDALKDKYQEEYNQIQTYKNSIAKLHTEILEVLDNSRYIRDNQRIILSAPEIIIGNVNKQGVLLGDHSKVIIRSSDVREEGDTILQRAPQIYQIAEQPGNDGQEHVCTTSKIALVARNILLESNTDTHVLPDSNDLVSTEGITLASNSSINIDSSRFGHKYEETLNNRIAAKNTLKSNLTKELDAQKTKIEADMTQLSKILEVPSFTASDILTRSNYLDIEEQHEEFNKIAKQGYQKMNVYFEKLSELAEVNRQLTLLEKDKQNYTNLKKEFEKKNDGTNILLNAEAIRMKNVDAEGANRLSHDASCSIESPKILLKGVDNSDKKEKIPNSEIELYSNLIKVHTDKCTEDENHKVTITSEGSIDISSKLVKVNALDQEIENGTTTTKALAKDSYFFVRTQNMLMNATDHEGKSQGQAIINAKNIRFMSMDVDLQDKKYKPTNLAEGSKLQLESESLFIGSTEEKYLTQMAQVAADQVKLFGKTTTELQQDEDKGLVEMTEGNVMINGEAVDVYGKFTSHGESTIPTLKSTSMEADHMKVNSSWQTPKTQEGVSAPASPDKTKKKSKVKLKLFGK